MRTRWEHRGGVARRVGLVAAVVCALAGGAVAGENSDSRPLGGGAASAAESRPLGGVGATEVSSGLGLGRTALALGFVVALAVGAGAVVKRAARAQGGLAAAMGAGGSAPSGILEVLGRYPIARGQKLLLLRVDRRVLLLSHVAPGRATRGGGMTTLCEITDPEEVASILTQARDAEGESLSARFRAMLAGYGHGEDVPEDEEANEPDPGRVVTLGPVGMGTVPAAQVPDRAELWDDRRIGAAPAVLSSGGGERGNDAVEAIRRRLEVMRRAAGGAA